MITKSVDDIRTDIVTAMSQRLPNLDLTTGTPERDLFVEAPIAGQLTELWNQLIYAAKLYAPLSYYADLSIDDVKTYMGNFNVTVFPATYSQGTVTFYTTTAPSQDITISNGTVVKTNSVTPIEFIVQGTSIIYASIASYYYNASRSRWEIDCSIKASLAGPEYRAGANTITVISTSIPGIDGCINFNPVSGGQVEETIESALKRVVDKFQGRGLSSTQGLSSYVRSFVSAVNVIASGDPEMQRDGGNGGAVDFYVIGTTSTNYSDDVTITSTGLENPLTVNYTSTAIVLSKQPVVRLISVTKNGVIISPSFYELVLDTGILKGSTRAFDKVELTSTGITSTGYFIDGDSIQIGYIYNSLFTTIESNLNSTTNHYVNRDYLVRGMTEVTINIVFRFKEVAGQDFGTVSSAVQLDVATFIDGIQNNGSVERADILGIIKSNASVDNVDLASLILTPVGGGTVTAQGDILLSRSEYPKSGTITITRWTS